MPTQIVAHLGCDCQATVPTRRGTAPVIGKALPRIPRVKDDSPPLIRGRESERLLANAFADAQQRGKAAYDGVIKAFYRDRRVAKIIHDRARATRCLDDKEEIQQQIAILLAEKLLDKMCSQPNEPSAIYTLIATTAHNVCLTLMKQNLRASERYVSLHPGDNLDDHFESLGVVADADDIADQVLARVDQEAAQAEFARRKANLMTLQADNTDVPASSAPSTPKHLSDLQFLRKLGVVKPLDAPSGMSVIKGIAGFVTLAPPAKGQEASPARGVRKQRTDFDPDGREKLIKVQKALHFNNHQLADALRVGQATFSSYIYGRVAAGVPVRVVKAAEDLLKNSKATVKKYAALTSKSQADIIDEWERALHINGRGAAETLLAKLLRVNQITVWRWKRPNGTTISPPDLAEYDAVVKKAVAEGYRPEEDGSSAHLPFPQLVEVWYSVLKISRRPDAHLVLANCIGLEPWNLSALLAPESKRPEFRRINQWERRVHTAAQERLAIDPLIDPTGMTKRALAQAIVSALSGLLQRRSRNVYKDVAELIAVSPAVLKAWSESNAPAPAKEAQALAAAANLMLRVVFPKRPER